MLRGDWTAASEAVQELLKVTLTHEPGIALQYLLKNRPDPPNWFCRFRCGIIDVDSVYIKPVKSSY